MNKESKAKPGDAAMGLPGKDASTRPVEGAEHACSIWDSPSYFY